MNSQFEHREIADSDQTGRKIGKGLGWLSLGLGLAELLAARAISRLIGLSDDGKAPTIVRLDGLRELATGALFFNQPDRPIAPWLRVAGDALDLASLALAMPSSESKPRTIGALAIVGGAAVLDAFAGIRQARRRLGTPIKRAVTIGKPAREVYDYWRQLENLPQFMSWIESVRDLGDNRSHWVVKTPGGLRFEYDAEITEDVPGRRIAWRSMPGASVPNRGMVTFIDAPGGRGTEIIVELEVAAPLGKTVATREAAGDLRRLKQVLEIGEITLSYTSIQPGRHPARPIDFGDNR